MKKTNPVYLTPDELKAIQYWFSVFAQYQSIDEVDDSALNKIHYSLYEDTV